MLSSKSPNVINVGLDIYFVNVLFHLVSLNSLCGFSYGTITVVNGVLNTWIRNAFWDANSKEAWDCVSVEARKTEWFCQISWAPWCFWRKKNLLGVGEEMFEELQHGRGSGASLGGIGKFCSTEERRLRFMSCYNY